MSEETRKDVITLSHVGMEFHLNKEKVDSLKEYFIKLVKHDIAYTEFWALKDVTFSVKQGDRVGILGLNGAGKSTLIASAPIPTRNFPPKSSSAFLYSASESTCLYSRFVSPGSITM